MTEDHVLLIVGGEPEILRALDLGWARLDVIRPDRIKLEGRRWKKAIITWWALEGMDHDFLDVLQSASIIQGSPVVIGAIPPADHAG